MFSIAAINDTDSITQWEPLAPTKEAQEFHLSQTYHEGLLKLQAKEYERARELLEDVLKDPLLSSIQVECSASDDHLLQLRFLALKNLATVFLEQGSVHYESALRCYLQAVEIDSKDSVVWNQLGTLACSMGSLSISRWAFEQGLFCSPNNWSCMEKLLEVLIAIGDEVACLSVAELILRHWPLHSRALHVKKTIENSEPIPFEPRGIDKLEPKHVRLKFIDKRKATDDNLNESIASKKLKQNIDLHLKETTWAALADGLLGILLPVSGSDFELGTENLYRSGDIRLTIHLPSSSENFKGSLQSKGNGLIPVGEMSPDHCNSESGTVSKEKDAIIYDEQRQERRSTRRLERLRSRKPGKEELDFTSGKDLAKVVIQFLEPFIFGGARLKHSDNAASSVPFQSEASPLDTDYNDVSTFVTQTSKNYGAYHMAQLLLEEAMRRGLVYQDAFVKFLELEKLTRHRGQNKTPECYLFLAELYHDICLSSSGASALSDGMSTISYLLCKIIELVALDYPFPSSGVSGNRNCCTVDSSQGTCKISENESISQNMPLENLFSTNKGSFWVRFFWLSGRLSVFEGNKAKAHEEFCISLSLLAKKENVNAPCSSVHLPHCKITKELTIDRILHEINVLKVGFSMKTTVAEMVEKEMYLECINLLAPLLFSTKNVDLGVLPIATKEDDGVTSLELSAINVLIKACKNAKPTDMELLLNCHRRKLQILTISAGMEECLSSSFHKQSGSRTLFAPEESRENSSKLCIHMVAEEVKEISQCASQAKNFFDQCGNSSGVVVQLNIIGDIQSLLLVVMCYIASMLLCKKSAGTSSADPTEEKHICCFVDSAIAFCKLQHLNPTIPLKTQVDLIVAIHDLLAEYGLCCAGNGGEGEEGAFLKLAIKHLLALDMKLKSNFHSSIKGMIDEHPSPNNDFKPSPYESNPDVPEMESDRVRLDESRAMEKDVNEENTSIGIPSHKDLEKEKIGVGSGKHCVLEKFNNGEKSGDPLVGTGYGLTEEEREELEGVIDNALDQCFFCLYGLNLRSDSCYEDDLAMHKNTSRGDYQTKEQCADVFQYVLSYAKASSKTGLVKLRRVLRAIRKHFPQPPEEVLSGNAIDKFLDDPNLCEDQLSEEAGCDGFYDLIMKIIFPGAGSLKKHRTASVGSSEPYLEVYCNLYYLLAQSEEMNATDKWPGFVLTKEGGEFVQQNANLLKYDLLYNPLRFESWQQLANIYDEEVDLLLNDGSKHVNVTGWRKTPENLPQRVETSRRRSRRCLLMSLALAKTSAQQCEIHELLALVYYDGIQNVVPLYDQRSVAPSEDVVWKMFCLNSMKHFEKAFAHKQDWSHAFYMGKLSEKLRYSHEISFSYYDKAIALNPSAVDPVYRMHASRLKLLATCGKQNLEALKVVTAYSFNESTKESVLKIISKIDSEGLNLALDIKDKSSQICTEGRKHEESNQLAEVWHMLYRDCLSALETCVEGDLKHFHKARYILAQGIYRRGEIGDLEKAKDELSFCFKSSRSSFTINMWEIDSTVKKGRRKTPGVTGNKKLLEVNLPESSRKFITCIRKYILFYLKLLEETGDISTLDRAYTSLRADKRFSLCLEDLIPVAVGRYIKALGSSMQQPEVASSCAASSTQHQLEKIFSLFTEQVTLWPDICSLPEIKNPEWSESRLYGYLFQYIQSLERNNKLETLEAINEKIRKRFKNPKLSNSNCAKVCRHASIAWCRSLIISLALITPSQSSESQNLNSLAVALDNNHLLFVDVQTKELWSSSFEDPTHLKTLETKWSAMLSKINTVMVMKASEKNLDTASTLLRCSYNFYRDSSCIMLPSAVNLYLVPSRLATETKFNPDMQGLEMLELSIPRKLLLWSYTLLHGRCTSISAVVKHCEENVKSKMKKGCGTSSMPSNTSIPTATLTHTGGGKDGVDDTGGCEVEAAPQSVVVALASVVPEGGRTQVSFTVPTIADSQKSSFTAPQLHHCNNSVSEKKHADVHETDSNLAKEN